MYMNEVQRVFQGRFKGIKESFKKVQCVYQENFKKAFNGVLRMFLRRFVLQFCCCLALIAATQAEGGLVCKHVIFWSFIFIIISRSCHYVMIFLSIHSILHFFSLIYTFSKSSLRKNPHFFGPNLHSSSFIHIDTRCMCNFLKCTFKEFLVRKFWSQNLHLDVGSEYLYVSLWRNQQMSPYKQMFSQYLLQCCTLLVCTILLCIMTSAWLRLKLNTKIGLHTTLHNCQPPPPPPHKLF